MALEMADTGVWDTWGLVASKYQPRTPRPRSKEESYSFNGFRTVSPDGNPGRVSNVAPQLSILFKHPLSASQ
jgi:hypothetical protein